MSLLTRRINGDKCTNVQSTGKIQLTSVQSGTCQATDKEKNNTLLISQHNHQNCSLHTISDLILTAVTLKTNKR